MADHYIVQVIPNDRTPNNYAMIHLDICPDVKKVGPIVGRKDLVGQWFDSYSYQDAQQQAGTDHRTGASRTVVDCPTCNPRQPMQQLSYYWRGSGGDIYEVRTCWRCNGAKKIDGERCPECGGHGVHGRTVTCSCAILSSPSKDCPICRGTGIRNYNGPMPPVISPDPR